MVTHCSSLPAWLQGECCCCTELVANSSVVLLAECTAALQKLYCWVTRLAAGALQELHPQLHSQILGAEVYRRSRLRGDTPRTLVRRTVGHMAQI